ncbi:MAG: efflux RND transporter periplasmic adaptor subunit [Opitutales bacterium]
MASEQLNSLLGNPGPSGSPPPQRNRGRLLSLSIPVGLILGFTLLMALLFGERLLPARPVQIANVVTLPEDPGAEPIDLREGASVGASDPFQAPVLFQATGWIEPDPLPTKVSTLVSGVVDEVFVLEGETVEKGVVLATLIDDDARLDLQTARASLQAARATVNANEAAVAAARAKLTTLAERIRGASAMRDYRRDAADRLAGAGREAVPQIDIDQSRQAAVTQEAEVAALQSEVAETEAQIQQLQSRYAEAEAGVALAETEVARRELALRRHRITSPIEGRVMRLFALPGQQRMLGPDNHDSAAIAYLYDPESLQARIDVPLAEAAQLRLGQAVRLRTNFLPDVELQGRVTRITGEADLQRNTLQAKVELLDPDDRLRPEMLCRAEFLAAGGGDRAAERPAAMTRVRLYVPESALLGRSGTSAEVWVIGQDGERVRRKAITLAPESREGYTRVAEGLKPGERVVVNPPAGLESGERVEARSMPET